MSAHSSTKWVGLRCSTNILFLNQKATPSSLIKISYFSFRKSSLSKFLQSFFFLWIPMVYVCSIQNIKFFRGKYFCLFILKNPKLPHTIINHKNKYIKNRIPCRVFFPHERHDRQPTNLSRDSIYYLTRISISVDFTPKLITFNSLAEQDCTETNTQSTP